MKRKLSLLTIAISIAGLTFGQELTSKKGETYLPEEGDWAIGIDAAPIFTYIGNTFNGNTANGSPTWSFVDPSMTIYGKLFKSAEMAYRGRIRLLGLNNTTNVLAVSNDDPTSDPYAMTEDVQVNSSMELSLGFGIEKRRGSTRLQGVYGAEVLVTFGNAATKYDYANAISSTNTAPSTADFGNNIVAGGGGARVTEQKSGSKLYFGVRPFIGAEYFILPKISIGGEFGYTLAYGSNGRLKSTIEYWDATAGAVKTAESTENTAASARLIIDNDNLGGSLKLMLHF